MGFPPFFSFSFFAFSGLSATCLPSSSNPKKEGLSVDGLPFSSVQVFRQGLGSLLLSVVSGGARALREWIMEKGK
jgi:hypothetical protein